MDQRRQEEDEGWGEKRRRMVEEQLHGYGRDIRDERVLRAMAEVPRHEFVPVDLRDKAYEDRPLPIGQGQTISQPYIVALMTEHLRLRPEDRVLEVGTGSGYQAAVLACLVREVWTVEIVPELGRQAAAVLARLGIGNVQVRIGDGHAGWPEHAPFDGIIVTCAPENVPLALVDQLADGGRLIIPVGAMGAQSLVLLEKAGDSLRRTEVIPVRFVPMTGRSSDDRQVP